MPNAEGNICIIIIIFDVKRHHCIIWYDWIRIKSLIVLSRQTLQEKHKKEKKNENFTAEKFHLFLFSCWSGVRRTGERRHSINMTLLDLRFSLFHVCFDFGLFFFLLRFLGFEANHPAYYYQMRLHTIKCCVEGQHRRRTSKKGR